MITTFNNNDNTRLNEHTYTLNDIVTGFGYDLGLSTYPIFNESYRAHLNSGIVEHFRYRRIAAETPAMFIFFLNRKMCEEMPTYNAIYKAINATDFDPFLTYARDENGTNSGTSTNNSVAAVDSLNTTSSTPASYLESPEGVNYMDSLAKGNSKTDNTDKATNSSDYAHHAKERSGEYANLIDDLILSDFLNVDKMVYKMLEPCFIQVWDNLPIY